MMLKYSDYRHLFFISIEAVFRLLLLLLYALSTYYMYYIRI